VGYRYETHLHTSGVSACAFSTAREQVRAYKARGYAGVIVTDHFVNGNTACPRGRPWDETMRCVVSGYEEAKAEGDLVGLDVFLGWEYSIRGSDFLTYGLDLGFLLRNPGLDRLDIRGYSAAVRDGGGYLAQAHPFKRAPYIVSQQAVDHALLDGIEAYNASCSDEENRLAMTFAERHGLPTQAGSDSHMAGTGWASGIELGRRARGVQDIIEAIKSGEATLLV